MKNTQSKIKPMKTGKQPGTTYCFGCKGYTENFRPQKVKMINKALREKSHCIVCRSNKSRFLRKTGELWVSMKDGGDGLGVKNICDLVLKEICGIYEKRKLTKEEIKNYKMTEREIFEKFDNLSND